MLGWITGFALLGSLGAIGAAALFLLFPENVRRFIVPSLISYATGTLLGAAFLGMIPAALGQAAARTVMTTVLAGMVLFFVLEKLVLWRHSHDEHCDARGSAGPLILFGDSLHNFVDGVVIAVAFMTSLPLGIATSMAVIAHEIPQEVGEFAILLDAGYSRTKALLLNALSASMTLPGGILAWFWLAGTQQAVPYVLALSAASFIYIATADLIPSLNKPQTAAASAWQFVLLVTGIATIALFHIGGGT
ncbi:MAG TPA: ZIP family metal transporter [Woeseiaceae bacterium]|nr:ZIP family metal transporter [Woeseiaceae bacterium]